MGSARGWQPQSTPTARSRSSAPRRTTVTTPTAGGRCGAPSATWPAGSTCRMQMRELACLEMEHPLHHLMAQSPCTDVVVTRRSPAAANDQRRRVRPHRGYATAICRGRPCISGRSGSPKDRYSRHGSGTRKLHMIQNSSDSRQKGASYHYPITASRSHEPKSMDILVSCVQVQRHHPPVGVVDRLQKVLPSDYRQSVPDHT